MSGSAGFCLAVWLDYLQGLGNQLYQQTSRLFGSVSARGEVESRAKCGVRAPSKCVVWGTLQQMLRLVVCLVTAVAGC